MFDYFVIAGIVFWILIFNWRFYEAAGNRIGSMRRDCEDDQ